jgi:hypothetical protein
MINPLSDRDIAHLSEPRRAAKKVKMPHFMLLTNVIANWFKVKNVYSGSFADQAQHLSPRVILVV